MVRKFEIIKVIIHHNRGLVLFAKHLGSENDCTVSEGSVLRDLRVYNYTDIQPLHDANGEPRPYIFCFRPFDMERFFDKSFKEGDRVTLTTPD